MSQIDNYIKLIVREPQTESDRKLCRLGRMITHEIYTFGPDDSGVMPILRSMMHDAALETKSGKTAQVSAFDPAVFRRAGIKISQIGALDVSAWKDSLPPSQLAGDRRLKGIT